MERTAGIEPALPPWEGGVLPLTPRPHGASGEIRTHDLRLTEAALCPLELQRQRSGSRTRICVRRFKDRPGCSNPLRNGAVSRCRPGLLPYKGRVTAVCDGGALGYENVEPPPGADPGHPLYEGGAAAVRGGLAAGQGFEP